MYIKYFSNLRDTQKKKVINTLRILKNNLSLENRKSSILELKKYGKSAEKKEIEFIIEKLKFQKIIRDKEREIYIPLNIDEIIENN
jgi:hypothetical protein